MEVVYNVKYKFKDNETKTKEELKELFNRKLLNIIMKLENQELGLNNP
jgi:HKD family nuclease